MTEPANTPGDDRGREAQVEQYPGEDRDRLFFLLCDVIGTELRRHDYAWNAGTCACGGRTDDDTAEDEHPAVEVASAVTEGLQKRRADVLRALAAPVETEAEAGRPDRMTPRDELVGQYRAVSDVLDDYLMREHGRVTSHNGWDLYLDLLAEQGYEVRALAASPPAQGPAETEVEGAPALWWSPPGPGERRGAILHLTPAGDFEPLQGSRERWTALPADAVRLAATPPAPEGEAEREGKHLRSLVQRWHAGEIVALELAQGVGAVAHRLVDEPPSPAGSQAEGAGETARVVHRSRDTGSVYPVVCCGQRGVPWTWVDAEVTCPAYVAEGAGS